MQVGQLILKKESEKWRFDVSSPEDLPIAKYYLGSRLVKEFVVMSKHEKINYVEFPSSDLAATKTFFAAAFDWEFVDYGPEYAAFSGAGIDGGFYSSELSATPKQGSVLIVLYSKNLEETQRKIEATGGEVVKAIFSFPGGRRFHFVEPGGNELAVWGDDA